MDSWIVDGLAQKARTNSEECWSNQFGAMLWVSLGPELLCHGASWLRPLCGMCLYFGLVHELRWSNLRFLELLGIISSKSCRIYESVLDICFHSWSPLKLLCANTVLRCLALEADAWLLKQYWIAPWIGNKTMASYFSSNLLHNYMIQYETIGHLHIILRLCAHLEHAMRLFGTTNDCGITVMIQLLK
jgi:hypothetical protein